MNLLTRLVDAFIEWRYISVGATLGSYESYSYMTPFVQEMTNNPASGEMAGMNLLKKRFSFWERLYAQRGYRTLSIDDFIENGGYGVPIEELVGVRRQPEEEPVLYSMYMDA